MSLEWPLAQARGDGRQSPQHSLEEDQVLAVVLVASSFSHHREEGRDLVNEWLLLAELSH